MFNRIVQKTDMTIVTFTNSTFLHWLCSWFRITYDQETMIQMFKFAFITLKNAGVPIDTLDFEGFTAYDRIADIDSIREFVRTELGIV